MRQRLPVDAHGGGPADPALRIGIDNYIIPYTELDLHTVHTGITGTHHYGRWMNMDIVAKQYDEFDLDPWPWWYAELPDERIDQELQAARRMQVSCIH